MRCERLDDLLPAYIDGDLPGRLNQRVSEHLDTCARCRQELDLQQQVLRTLDAGRRPVGIDLWSDFSRRLAEAESTRQRAGTRSVVTMLRARLSSPLARLLWQPGLATALAAAAVALIARSGPELPSFTVGAGPSASATQLALVPEQRLSKEQQPAELPRTSNTQPSSRAAVPVPVVRVSPAKRRSAPPRVSGARVVRVTPDAALAAEDEHRPPRAQADEGMRAGSVRLVRVAALVSPETPPTTRKARPVLQPTDRDGHLGYSLAARTGATHLTTSDPLNIAEALVAAQQDAANDQMAGELLRLAQEVVRVSGEPAAEVSEQDGSRT
jgi:hypothetical protein